MSDAPSPSVAPVRWVPALTLLLLDVALVFSTQAAGWMGHTPLLWYGLVLVVSLRHRHLTWVPTLFFPATAVFVLWFLSAADDVTRPLALAFVLAYLLDPLVDRLEPRFGRTRGILLIAVPALVLLGFFTALLVPAVLSELEALVRKLPELRDPLARFQQWVQTQAGQLGIELKGESLGELILPRLQSFAETALGASAGVWRGVQGLFDFLGLLVITPVVGFYLLRDFDRLRAGFLRVVPEGEIESVGRFFENVDHAVSSYLRGQLLVGVVQGVLFGLGLTLLGVDYAVLVGLSAVVFNMVPFIGSVLTAVLALAVALLTDPSWASVFQVGLLYGVLQTLDAAVLSPRIVGSSVELHPVVVMISIMLGGQFFGMVGVLLAVPVAAVLRASIFTWTRQWLELLPGLEPSGATSDESLSE